MAEETSEVLLPDPANEVEMKDEETRPVECQAPVPYKKITRRGYVKKNNTAYITQRQTLDTFPNPDEKI